MCAAKTPRLLSGTSGLVLPVPNKEALPPAFRNRPRLSYYGSLFNSIEVNSSFYRIPLQATFSRWRTEVPANFEFTVKLWRGITHAPGLRFEASAVQRFLTAAGGLLEKKGCLLVQLPPALTVAAADRLDHLLETIRRLDPDRTWKQAVEFRHPSWYGESTGLLLRRHDSAWVLHDRPPAVLSELPSSQASTPFVYLRFHGPAGDYRGGYTPESLAAWAARIGRWLAAGKMVYVYFNNTIGDALADLSRLGSLLPGS